jgi:methylglutaconyl-CoA hydratase
MTELVHYEVSDGVARITLDSPHNRNALSRQLVAELQQHLATGLDDDGVRVIVLTGEGKVFCSGADLKEQRQANEAGETAKSPGAVEVMRALWDSPKPVLGRMNGHARAGGLGLVGACDIVVAPRSATFGFAEVRIGVVPAVIAVTTMPRMTPRAALELFLTGENFDADRAAEIGLINRAVPDEELDEEVERYLGMLRLGSPGAMAAIKHGIIARVPSLPRDEAFEEMLALSLDRFSSEEALEGMRAFAEKRKPSWVTGTTS